MWKMVEDHSIHMDFSMHASAYILVLSIHTIHQGFLDFLIVNPDLPTVPVDHKESSVLPSMRVPCCKYQGIVSEKIDF